MRHTISVLVENKFGVLTRVAGLFSGRGYNIDTLNVGPTHDPKLSRMTIVTHGDEATVEQIIKQLNKPLFTNIPEHLQAKGKGRSIKMTGLTKQQKVELQLQQSQARISR